jgi:S-adenosyl-L-methionine hydrolase (adenosine-forming)
VSIISLTTDFGIKDGNVGVMRGVIWGLAPQVQIADLSHQIAPQNVVEAALILARSAPYFPADTIHVVVVDPGVGTQRRPIAAQLATQRFVGPDNGACSLLLEWAERQGGPVRIVHLDRPAYWLAEVSHVFHGRDIFSPVAAHWAVGAALEALGTPIGDPVRVALPQPQPAADGWRGEVIHIDHFGNLATNLRREHLQGVERIVVRLAGREIHGLFRTFGERQAGELIALYGSTGSLIVSEVNGDAAARLGVTVGAPVEVAVLGGAGPPGGARDA